MPAEDRTPAGTRRQVWHSVQDNNSAASRGQAGATAANSVARCRAVARPSSTRCRPLSGGDSQNRARESRDKENWGSGWRARIFATAGGPEWFNFHRSRSCSLTSLERLCAVCEPTAGECGGRFEFASCCIAGYSADSNKECTTTDCCSKRFRTNFAGSDRRNFFLFCGRDEVILKT